MTHSHACCTPTRRSLLATLAGLGAGALIGSRAAIAQARRTRIDIHHHLFPTNYRAAIDEIGVGPLAKWTPEQSLEEMDKNGIATSVISVSPPGVWFGNAEQSRGLSRDVNDYGAKMAADHPGRFGLFAAMPLPDIDGSLREIEYALDTLKADGIGVMTNYGDVWLGDAKFAPIWEELNRRKAVVYTHPNTPSCCTALKDEVGPGTIEWATDTTRTTASLVFSGSLARYPDIQWILSHGGGTLPFLLSRFQVAEAALKDKDKKLPRGVMYELKKLHYDTAQANHPGALAALLKLVPVSQILFGSDYPYRTEIEEINGLGAQGFSAAEMAAIEHENAARMMPKLPKA